MVVNSTTDIVNALVAKGVLTEEEGALLNKGREGEAAGQAKALKKAGRVTISDAIDNATIYGSVRVREEYRAGSGLSAANTTADQRLVRTRGKFEFGAKTTAGKWYSDVAFVTGSDASARSDNFTFGGGGTNLYNQKESIYLKRAMLGYKPTDWLTLEAGRMANPLYTTQMMWDGDYSVSGATEKFNYTTGNLDLFATLGQWAHYKMERNVLDNISSGANPVSPTTGEIYAFQGGAKYAINDRTSAKAALTHYVYGSESGRGIFQPTLKNTGPQITASGVNDLNIYEIPAEVNYMVTDKIGARVYGDYVVNTDADKRASAARIGNANFTDVDDTAWMIGLGVASAKDLKSFESNKAKAGDWSGNLWYQEIGLFAVDPALGDSDIFDSRLNFKGVTFKGQYLLEDNVALNVTAAHGSRLNDKYNAVSTSGVDLKLLNLNDFDLLQLDVTYKF